MSEHEHPALKRLRDRVREATARRTPLRIRAGGTKDFYGNPTTGELLDPREYSGIVDYAPTELVVTVRSGTPLAQLEAALAEQNQMLPFEPPHFGDGATVGGAVAAGLAGPRRVAAGSLRDLILGASVINGNGEVLAFGGRVMKNVAGYDMARTLAGSLGTLGVLVDLSLKVLPKPVAERTLRFDLDEATAIRQLNEWGGQPLPISASAWLDGVTYVRLSGARAAVDAAQTRLAVADGVEDRGRRPARVVRRGLGVEQGRYRLGHPVHQRHLDENQRLVGQRRMEEGEASSVDLEPSAQVIPAPDFVHRLVRDDLLEQVGRRVPIHANDPQESRIEP